MRIMALVILNKQNRFAGFLYFQYFDYFLNLLIITKVTMSTETPLVFNGSWALNVNCLISLYRLHSNRVFIFAYNSRIRFRPTTMRKVCVFVRACARGCVRACALVYIS
jgi:hypothetical protein